MSFFSHNEKFFKIPLTMRFLVLSLILSIGVSWANYAQSALISIDAQNQTIAEILEAVEQQSEFSFIYDSKSVDTRRKLSVHAENKSIFDVLNQMFTGSDIAYAVINKKIVLRKDDEMLSLVQQGITITGTVNEDGNPLPGVSVVVKGSNIGTATDADGRYQITVPDADAILQFSFVGYTTREILVGNQRVIDVGLAEDASQLEEVVVIGYGTARKRDLTGSLTRVNTETFKTRSMSQFTEMLAGGVAGLNMNQSTDAAGGVGSLQVRGPTSITASGSPLIVLDGAVYYGSIRDINPMDIVSIDIMKDASSAAVFGSNAASGVILITTNKGEIGKKPTINVTAKIGMAEDYKQRRGLGPKEYLQYRGDWLRTMYPTMDYHYYTHPDQLPSDMNLNQWFELSNSPQSDKIEEFMTRLMLFPEERRNYLAGRTMDMYDEVFRKGLRQDYDISVAGGSSNSTYYWSIGYNDYEGIRVGDQYSTIRTRLNVDFKITDWLNVGVNAQFSDRNESSVAAAMGFYSNSPYGEMFDDEGNLKNLPHGHSGNPLLAYYRTDRMDKKNGLFANIYSDIKLPFGIKYRLSFQPFYQASKYYNFVEISKKLGGLDTESPSGERRDASDMNWMVDNILSWSGNFGNHRFDVTLLANVEENRYWYSQQSNVNFQPNQQLGFNGLQFGDSPGINNNDTHSTGAAYMARLNYSLLGKYLLSASVRRDGFSAFGVENPWATFPSVGVGWMLSEEDFFTIDAVDRLKLRVSWGINGNRNIGGYSALSRLGSNLYYDGSNVRVGVSTTSLANSGLRWERTETFNLGMDIALLKNRIDFVFDVYSMTTTDLLLNRQLPRITGFTTITANLGELGNKGFDFTLNTVNINRENLQWNSSLVFSMNRNKINKLFGDFGTYTLLNQERTGELPDFTNRWFPGYAYDAVWDYKILGIWQTPENDEAARYNLRPGDYKAEDVNNDGIYYDTVDKQFIGYTAPRARIGFRNDVRFLKNFTASVFIRAELGHISEYANAIYHDPQGDRRNRDVGPIPYWMPDRPNDEYPNLNPRTSPFGGGIRVFKPRSFMRVQDVSLSYDMPVELARRIGLNHMQVFCSIQNLATITKWPGWDPESGMNAMPRIYTLGINFSL